MNSAEIRIFSSPAARSALLEVGPQFERDTGHRLLMDFSNIAACKKKIADGEAFDIAFVSPKLVDELLQQGMMATGTRLNVGRTGLGVIVRKGAPRPDISSADAVKRALLGARAVLHAATGESGLGFMAVLDSLGIAAGMQPTLRPSSDLTGDLESGVGEFAVAGIGAALANPQVDYAGPLPADIQQYVYLAGGVSARAPQPAAARAFIRYLSEPDVVQVLKAKGLEPY